MLRGLELPPEAFAEIRSRCVREGIEFLSTAFDVESADLVYSLGVRRFKVASGDVTDLPLLDRIGSFRLPVILSTGMAEEEEIAEALSVLERSGAPCVTLLHCISSYPAAPGDLQLLSIPRLRKRFGRPVGYSDHSLGTDAALAARTLGAVIIEKHLTLDRTLPGPDHAASAEPADLADLVARLRTLESMLGNGRRQLSGKERANRLASQKSVTALRAIRAGDPLKADDLALLRPGTGIPPRDLRALIGRRAARDIPPGESLRWDMVL
jgi:sialic acid synthase SpsE